MRVVTKRRILEFGKQNSEAVDPLRRWLKAIRAAQPNNPAELKRVFGSTDFVDDLTVFDIGGNKYRLIAFVHYRRQIVYIKHILTHKRYGQGDWKK